MIARCGLRPSAAGAQLALRTNDKAWLEGVLVDVCVQHGVLELLRRIAIYKDTGAAVLDHDVAFEGLVYDGVIPSSVDGRVRAGGDSEPCSRAGILTNDELDDGADGFRREHEHAREYAG